MDFGTLVDSLSSDVRSLFGPDYDDLQEQIWSLTIQLNRANQSGQVDLAQRIAQQIADLQAQAAQMPNPMVSRIETIENVDRAISGFEWHVNAAGEFMSDQANKIISAALVIGLVYVYFKAK